MIFSVGIAIRQVFFDSLAKAGCLSLDTYNPDSDSDIESELEPTANSEQSSLKPPRSTPSLSKGFTSLVNMTSSSPSAALVSAEDDKIPLSLVGFRNFKRNNPRSDRFPVINFHHVEFWCGDATNVSRRFSWGLGMPSVAKSDLTTGNKIYCSHVLKSQQLQFVFTAPYSSRVDQSDSQIPLPNFNADEAKRFFSVHGLAVRAVAIQVADASKAYSVSVSNGAKGVSEPVVTVDNKTGGSAVISEVALYGDVVLRFVSLENYDGPFLPHYEKVENSAVMSFGLTRLDHAVGNVEKLLEAVQYIAKFSGFHEFAEFTAEDVGTVDSGLNSMVLASNNEMVLLPVNEPTFGTKRQSQIQTYLDHNEGPGLQHLALVSSDIFLTLREMRMRSEMGGFEFMPRPSAKYYVTLPSRIGNVLTEKQLRDCEELGILVDKDDQGILLQIFTKPVGDRPTIFLEIIQRIGCMSVDEEGKEYQKGGCGGFGKGNFSELFKSIEDFERSFDTPVKL